MNNNNKTNFSLVTKRDCLQGKATDSNGLLGWFRDSCED